MGADKQHTKTEILALSIPLFADSGYAGVSMRQIARAVGIQAASLYHHFPDKQTLYIEALTQAFSKHADFMNDSFTLQASPEERLHHLISGLCTQVKEDNNFRRLMQREILDGDTKRLQLLADQVFGNFFKDMNELCRSLNPDRDSHLMAISILGLVLYHFQITPIRPFLPGFQVSHNDPEVIADQIFTLLKNGCR
ncbi:MAG: TetR/AcrR family transcriptional regulator [Pseudomonadota bacterium]|nr:TetR/AcrR family transcriptional regulator [Pseudomonadota bacterium]